MVAVQDQFKYSYPGSLPSSVWQLHSNGSRPKMIDYRVVGADASGSYFARHTTTLGSPNQKVGLSWHSERYGGRAGLVARSGPDINAVSGEFYYMEFRADFLRLWRHKNAGADAVASPAVDTALTSSITVALVEGDVVEFEVTSNVLTARVNGTAVVTFTDPTPINLGDYAGMHFSGQGRAMRFYGLSGSSTLAPWSHDEFHILKDDFDTQNPRWTWNGAATVDTVATEAVIPAQSTYGSGFATPYVHDLRNSSIYFSTRKWPKRELTSTSGTEAGFTLERGTNSIKLFRDGAGTMRLRVNDVDQASVTYDSVKHRYVRFRESAGTFYLDTSRTAAPGDWQAWVGMGTPFDVSGLYASAWSGYYGTVNSPGEFRVGGVNVVDPATTPSGALLYDSFNRANSSTVGAADTGQVWSGDTSEYEILDGLLHQTSSNSGGLAADCGTTTPDFSAYMMNNPTAGHWWGILINAVDHTGDNGYRIQVGPTGQVKLALRLAGVTTDAAVLPDGTAQYGDLYRITNDGVTVRAYRNGSEFGSMPVDATLAANTLVAVNTGEYQGSGYPLYWDDATVYAMAPASTEPTPTGGIKAWGWTVDGVKKLGKLHIFPQGGPPKVVEALQPIGDAAALANWDTMIFQDEFDGTTFDPANWRVGAPWQGSDSYAQGEDTHTWIQNPPDTGAVEVANGKMTLKARRRNVGQPASYTKSDGTVIPLSFTGANLRTDGDAHPSYDPADTRFALPQGTTYSEARITATAAKGLWIGWWWLGLGDNADQPTGFWPETGELDFEVFSGDPASMSFSGHWTTNLHWLGSDGGHKQAQKYTGLPANTTRTLGLFRSETEIIFFVDGLERARYTRGQLQEQWPGAGLHAEPPSDILWTAPMMNLLDVKTGGYGGQGYTEAEMEDGDVIVEWTRVWQDSSTYVAPPPPPEEPLTNRYANPGAEVDTTGWALGNGTLSRSTTVTRNGSAGSFRLVPNAPVDPATSTTINLIPNRIDLITEGMSYRIEAWLHSSVSRSARVRVAWKDSTGTTLSDVGGTTVATVVGGWTRILFEGVAPAGTTQVEPYYQIQNCVATDEHHADDLYFGRLDGVTDVSTMTWQQAWDDTRLGTLQAWFEHHTGPKVALTKTHSGTYTVNSQAAADALVGTHVTGSVAITVSNVRAHDFKVTNDGSATPVNVSGGVTGVTIEDFEIDGAGLLSPASALGGGTWANITVRRANIHHALDRIRAFEGSTYQQVYLHDAVVNPNYVSGTSSQHADAVQWVRGAAGKPSRVYESWIDSTPLGPNVTGALMVSADAASIEGVTVDHSYINGGSYTVQVDMTSTYAITDININDNRFGRDYSNGVWSNAVNSTDPGSTVVERLRNVWADDLTPVDLTWGKTR